MSPELQTLDELLCENLQLSFIRTLFPDDKSLATAIDAMLRNGHIRLKHEGLVVPEWQWRELFSTGGWASEQSQLWLELTDQGAKFIA